MPGYTVNHLAKLSGVSVRTLHHYDSLGLLTPARVGTNGYRYYGRDELLRLQQILFHRELGFSLEEIRTALDAPGFDRAAALRRHRIRLEADIQRFRHLIRTIDETLEALEGHTAMDEKAMYQGFDPKKQAEHEAWLEKRYGETARRRIEASRAKRQTYTQADHQRLRAELDAIESGMTEALGAGLPADSVEARALVRRQHAWVSENWDERPSREAFIGLGRLYCDHPEFRAHYEARARGLAEYFAHAMRMFAEKELT
jgi:DNA-binding transcriptional MerR regulator